MRRPFMAMCIAGVAGMAGALMLPVWAGCLVVLLCVCIYIKLKKTANQTQYGVWIAVFLIVGFCRVWMENAWQTRMAAPDDIWAGQRITFVGTIQKAAEKEKSIWLTMKKENEVVLVILQKEKIPESSGFYKGQIYEIKGEIKRFSHAANPGQFDEAVYYKAAGIRYKVMASQCIFQAEGDLLHRHLRWLEKLRMKIGIFYQSQMSLAGSGVMKAAVLGDRSGFGEDIRRVWQQNGWMHLVTVSGLHLSFIAMGIYRRMRQMTVSLTAASMAAIAAMLAYGYMTDFGESMIRACIMMFLCLLAVLAGRRYDRPTALAFSAFIMMFLRPNRIFNSGFILSFMAIIGTCRAAGSLNTRKAGDVSFDKLSGTAKIKIRLKESLLLQADIFAATLPVIASTMYEIPVLGFFYNLFMIPLIAVIVPAAFVAGAAGSIFAGAIGTGSGWIMRLIDGILRMVEQLPAKTYICGCPKWWQTAGYIVLMGLWMLSGMIEEMKKEGSAADNGVEVKQSGYRCIWQKKYGRQLIVIAAVILLIGIPDHSDRILFLDVGQGDGICFMSRDGETVMLDGGSSDVKGLWQYRIAPALKYYGRNRVDVWLITHGDADHISGIQDALKDTTYKIDSVISPEAAGSEALLAIADEAKAAGASVSWIYPGGEVKFGRFLLTCLYPPKGILLKEENDRSLVLSMRYEGRNQIFRALFTGDLGASGEEKIAGMLSKQTVYDLLKVGHHGSKTSTSAVLLERIRPAIALISCGENNRYGHPHQETLAHLDKAGAAVLRTDQMGAVEIMLHGSGAARIYVYGEKRVNKEKSRIK